MYKAYLGGISLMRIGAKKNWETHKMKVNSSINWNHLICIWKNHKYIACLKLISSYKKYVFFLSIGDVWKKLKMICNF